MHNKPTCRDAVIVVPGIMGSELCDAEGNVVWGLSPKPLAKAWLTGNVRPLHVIDDDLTSGRRLRATRLLRVPAYLPILGGIEPYSALIGRIKETVVDPRAAAEFPYDWRLSVAHNGAKLAERCIEHLDRWRAIVQNERYCDPTEVKLVIVAHSMGGLVTKSALTPRGLAELVRFVITLGTPYFGSVKTVQTLATGSGAPVPARAARALAATCPGVYDLLPRYRCMSDTTRRHSLRMFTVEDAARIGADRELARDAEERWSKTSEDQDGPPLMAVVGVEQPTLQSATIDHGECNFVESLDGIDHRGDATVFRQSAAPAGTIAFPLPQRHGALAKSSEALAFVADKLVGADTGPPLGTRRLSVHIPDLVPSDAAANVSVQIADSSPVGITVKSTDLQTGRSVTWTEVVRDGPVLTYSKRDLRPGLHRVAIKAGGFSPISDLLLVLETE